MKMLEYVEFYVVAKNYVYIGISILKVTYVQFYTIIILKLPKPIIKKYTSGVKKRKIYK